jgi:endonuclease/exonuclease/phosphatase family metal-dependent hydrolase
MKNLLPAGLLLAGVLLIMAGCVFGEKTGSPQASGAITLMTWNVHNLFDGTDNGYEYNEYLQSAGWSHEKYMGRINTAAAAIGKIEPMPDIILLQEIESFKVLEDLASSLASGYAWGHFANNPGAALGLGILSRIPISGAMAHSVTVNGGTAPRPVLEARIQAQDGEFVVFACHWKSKLGGAATEDIRRASARVILRRIRELREDEPGLGVIAAGDLNENHDEFFKQNASMICALIPDDPYCAKLTGGRQNDFIVISKNIPPSPVYFPQETVVLFSPWMRDLENGSYFYKDDWETIDHFLVSDQFFDNTGWEYEKAFIADFSPFVNSGGTPFSYNTRTGSGLSDHLPLLLALKFQQ